VTANHFSGNWTAQINGVAQQSAVSAGTAALPSVVRFDDVDTGLYWPASNELGFTTAGTERCRVDASGRLLVGAAARVLDYDGTTGSLQVIGTGSGAKQMLARYSASTAGPEMTLAKSRGAAAGTHAAVASADFLGVMSFVGSDGTNMLRGAQVAVKASAAPGAAAVPSEIVFLTTSTGAAAPTETLKLTSQGYVTVKALPTTAAGLPSGTLWNDAGTLKVAP
jgi:hypothetical protein